MLLTAPGKCGKRCGAAPVGNAVLGAEMGLHHKVDGLLQGGQKARVALFQDMRSMSCEATAVPASSNVALPVSVLQLFEPPAVLAHGVVPLLERCFARKVM